jgi:hypothetical protein
VLASVLLGGRKSKLWQHIWCRCYDFKNIFAEKFSEKNWRFRPKLLLFHSKMDHSSPKIGKNRRKYVPIITSAPGIGSAVVSNA